MNRAPCRQTPFAPEPTPSTRPAKPLAPPAPPFGDPPATIMLAVAAAQRSPSSASNALFLSDGAGERRVFRRGFRPSSGRFARDRTRRRRPSPGKGRRPADAARIAHRPRSAASRVPAPLPRSPLGQPPAARTQLLDGRLPPPRCRAERPYGRCAAMSPESMPATATGFFIASRRNGSPSSWFNTTSMKVVTPSACAAQLSRKAEDSSSIVVA